jgi:hypothetical protein
MSATEEGIMAIKVGINGFGRIQRNIMRASLGDPDIDFVAVNNITDPNTLAHLLKYDSALGNLEEGIAATESGVRVSGDKFKVDAVDANATQIDSEPSVDSELIEEGSDLPQSSKPTVCESGQEMMKEWPEPRDYAALDLMDCIDLLLCEEILEEDEKEIYLCEGQYTNDQGIGNGLDRYNGGSRETCGWRHGRLPYAEGWHARRLRARPLNETRQESLCRRQESSQRTFQSHRVPATIGKDVPLAVLAIPAHSRCKRPPRLAARGQSEGSDNNHAIQGQIIYSDIHPPHSVQHSHQSIEAGKGGKWLYGIAPLTAQRSFFEIEAPDLAGHRGAQTQQRATTRTQALRGGGDIERDRRRTVVLDIKGT